MSAADLKYYLRPLGLLYGEEAERAVTRGEGFWLCGGAIAFLMLDVIRRAKDGTVERSLVPAKRLMNWAQENELGEDEAGQLSALMNKLCAPRAGYISGWPRVMGIVNVTPDSFSDGGEFFDAAFDPAKAIEQGKKLAQDGAQILDIGGESTRPNADPVSIEEELARVVPVIKALAPELNCELSIDSRNSAVISAALDAGAQIINDVSALTHDENSAQTARRSNAPVVLMHAQGSPKTMQLEPRYENVVLDIYDWLEARIDHCLSAGIARDKLIIDPGIGFGKTAAHNAALISSLSLFHCLGVPVLLGASRKSFIGQVAQEQDPKQRLAGSLALALAGAEQGAQILRVHDVKETNQALALAQSLWAAGQLEA